MGVSLHRNYMYMYIFMSCYCHMCKLLCILVSKLIFCFFSPIPIIMYLFNSKNFSFTCLCSFLLPLWYAGIPWDVPHATIRSRAVPLVPVLCFAGANKSVALYVYYMYIHGDVSHDSLLTTLFVVFEAYSVSLASVSVLLPYVLFPCWSDPNLLLSTLLGQSQLSCRLRIIITITIACTHFPILLSSIFCLIVLFLT